MKKGLDYFPLDCVMSDSVRLIEAEFGIEGFGILVRLWQDIYKIDGYYKKFDKDVLMLFAKEIYIPAEKLEKFINTALERGIFDKKIYESFGVLTSKELQNRFLKCTKKRKTASIKEEYLLLNDKENDSFFKENDAKNEEKGGSFKQSKVKESKVNKSKAEESKKTDDNFSAFGKYENVYLTPDQEKELKAELKGDADEYIMRLDEYIQETGKEYKDHFLTIKRWHRADRKNKESPVKKSRFANYTDTNGYDYKNFSEDVLNKLLEEP